MSLPSFSRKPVTQKLVRQIAQFCVKEMGVKWSEVVLHRRDHHGIVWARQVSQYIIREVTGARLEQIGSVFSRHHGAILHSSVAVKGYMQVYPELRIEINALMQKVTKRFNLTKHPILLKKVA